MWFPEKIPREVEVFGGFLKYIFPFGVLGMVILGDI